MLLKVFRYKEGAKPRYDGFQVPLEKGMTVLDALFYARDEIDDGLSFRFSCRGAVCGTCGMLINHVPRLACRTQVEGLLRGEYEMKLDPSPALDRGEPFDPRKEVLIEPLSNLPVLRDLVVDMDQFFDKYKLVRPTFKGKPISGGEYLLPRENVRELERYTNCILCAACYSACPVNHSMPEYLGPAALAKLYRFVSDSREGRSEERLKSADLPSGWWGCVFHGNCTKVCPKGVPPSIAIGRAQKELKMVKEGRDE